MSANLSPASGETVLRSWLSVLESQRDEAAEQAGWHLEHRQILVKQGDKLGATVHDTMAVHSRAVARIAAASIERLQKAGADL